MNFCVLDKLIEAAAPSSPRGIKNHEDVLVFLRGFGLSFGQQFVRLGCRRRGHKSNRTEGEQEHEKKSAPCGVHDPILPLGEQAFKPFVTLPCPAQGSISSRNPSCDLPLQFFSLSHPFWFHYYSR